MDIRNQQAVSAGRRLCPLKGWAVSWVVVAAILLFGFIGSSVAVTPANALEVSSAPLETTVDTSVQRPTVLTFFERYFAVDAQIAPEPGHNHGLGAKMSEVHLDVPLVVQFPSAPSGCEISSLTMLLQYAGYATTLEESLQTIPYSGVPTQGFTGNPRGWSGWTIYPEAAGPWIAERIGGYRDLTGVSLNELRDVLRQGKPIVVWFLHPSIGYHCLCITGFDVGGFYLNDPYGYKDWYVDDSSFDYYWSGFYRMALSY